MKNIPFYLLMLLLLALLSCRDELSLDDDPTGFPPPPPGIPFPTGEMLSEKITKAIGPAGGSLASPDGEIELVFPAGALSQLQEISLQQVKNTAPLGVGSSWEFGPDGIVFAKPVELVLHYNAEMLDGTTPEMVGIAYQDANNLWQAALNVVVDKNQRTITASLPHFSRWTFFAEAKLIPEMDSVLVTDTLIYRVVGHEYLLQQKDNCNLCDLLAPLTYPTVLKDALIKKWYLDGEYNSVFNEKGRLEENGSGRSTMVYTAPEDVPDQDIVAISTELALGKGTFLLIARARIVNPNTFRISSHEFKNVAGAVSTLENGVLTLFMYDAAEVGYDASFSFMMLNYNGVGTYSFSEENSGSADLRGIKKTYVSVGYDGEGNPIFNGKIKITSAGNNGEPLEGEITGTFYEPQEDGNNTIYIPKPGYARFSLIPGV